MDPENQYPARPEHHLDFIDEQSQCCLCGSQMEFDYDIQPEDSKILQKSICSMCGISPKDQEHTIH